MILSELKRLTGATLEKRVAKAIKGRKWNRRLARACNKNLFAMCGEPGLSGNEYEAFLILQTVGHRERCIALLLALQEETP